MTQRIIDLSKEVHFKEEFQVGGNWGMAYQIKGRVLREGAYLQMYELFCSLMLFVQASSIPFLLLHMKPDWKIICKSVWNSCHKITNFYILHKE